MRSNCYVWALIQHRRRDAEWRAAGRPAGREPALRFRRSRLLPTKFPHAQVEFWDGQQWAIEQFVPVDKGPLRWWQLYRATWYTGEIKRGDAA